MAGRSMFEAFAELADPLDSADVVVNNDGELALAVDEVCADLEGLLGR